MRNYQTSMYVNHKCQNLNTSIKYFQIKYYQSKRSVEDLLFNFLYNIFCLQFYALLSLVTIIQ